MPSFEINGKQFDFDESISYIKHLIKLKIDLKLYEAENLMKSVKIIEWAWDESKSTKSVEERLKELSLVNTYKKMINDYIMEAESLKLIYETPFPSDVPPSASTQTR